MAAKVMTRPVSGTTPGRVKPGRKMGHLTALADTPEAAATLVRDARAALTASHVRA